MTTTLTYTEAIEQSQYIEIANISKKIWNKHYSKILTQAQIDYMLAKFQSEDAIKDQIKNEDYSYFIISENNKTIGYFAYKPDKKSLFISKIYLLDEFQHKGIGAKTIAFLKRKAVSLGLKTLFLTVNKHNINSINAYKKYGFIIENSIITPIGNNFVMDDFVMVLNF